MNKQLKPAFTLIELLIVIGVIAILSAGIIIGVRDATRAARETAALVFSTTMKKTMITDMVGEWTFDDETNPGYDSSGKGNNGTLVGPPTWTADGKVRGALEFNGGGGDYVNCGNKLSLNITDEITIEAWVKSSSATNQVIVMKAYKVSMSSGAPGWNLYLGGQNSPYGDIRFGIGDGAEGGTVTFVETDSGGYNDENWHHIVAVANIGSTVDFYIDGNPDGLNKDISAESGSISNSYPCIIGINYNAGAFDVTQFNGTLDEVRIYDAALEASQIKARYVEGLQKLHAEGKLDGKEYYQRLTETGF